ncbi:hypothetical protein ABZ471_37640 [Streptomyces sp. NPDC005728]|uniref:hypothetical protein n=1 Tax=Streptomyces sp. NPDC005728 TaxID=3157054 RepID=UPI0033ED15A2
MPRDQRLVQTAVIGHTESEIPVVLPIQAGEVALFRHSHAADTFWCGRWLGGCGGRLTIKTYEDRVCHFAHIPDPGRGPCHRAAVGVASADHLYIKQQILAWLASQSVTARTSIPDNVDRVGGEVLFEPGGHGCLRVLLDTQATLPAAVDGTQLLLGTQVAHDPHRLTIDGYVLRIRCDTDASGRRVLVGTQPHDGTQWFHLDECRLMPWGLSTPAVEEVRRLRGTVRPLGIVPPRAAPAKPAPAARPVAAVQTHDDRAEAFAALQQAVETDQSVRELRHCLTRAEAAVRGGASAVENELLRRATDLLLRKERGVGVSAPPASSPRRRLSRPEPRPARTGSAAAGEARRAAEAVADLLDALDRRRGHFFPGEQQRLVAQLEVKARQADPWLTARQRKQITVWKNGIAQAAPGRGKALPAPSLPPAAGQEPAPEAKRKPKHTRREGIPTTHPSRLNLIADGARDVLEHAARLGKTISFELLCTQVKGLRELNEEQQRRVLKAACAPTRAGQPLAALITTGSGIPHPHYRHLARQPGDGSAAQAAWQKAVAGIHASYQPGPPPPGAQPGSHHEGGGAPDQ